MSKKSLNDLEASLNKEMEKRAEDINIDEIKSLLDQLGEKPLTDEQKRNVMRLYEELKSSLFN